MGYKPIPSYANIFMAMMDKKISKTAEDRAGIIKFYKRFLDDIISVWYGTTKELHALFKIMNTLHPTNEFTMNHTTPSNDKEKCECEDKKAIPFLDTSLSIEDGQIVVDLYKKPTDKKRYLLPYSCHPLETRKSIPFSPENNKNLHKSRYKRKTFGELKKMLLDRYYKSSMIDSSIGRPRQILRDKALQRVAKPKHNKRPVHAVTWDPRLPNLPQVQGKHWRSMTLLSPYMREVFPEPALVAYKRQQNISDFVITAKVPPGQSSFYICFYLIRMSNYLV